MIKSRMTRRAVIAGGSAAGWLLAHSAEAGEADPKTVGRKIALEFASRKDIMMYKVGDVTSVHYAEAATAYGAAKLGGHSHDKAIVAAVAGRYQRTLDEQIPNSRNHVDANVFGIWPLELYRQTGDPAYLSQGLEFADDQWARLSDDGLTRQTRFWIDDVWMIGTLQAQAFRATQRPVYIDRAGRELAAYIQKLQQPNGLFFHGPEARFHWGRGNGWVAAGCAEVLENLPKSHPSYAIVHDGYLRMMAALLHYQGDDGMWRQLVDRPEAWPESSCTAMFAFAFATGVRNGVLHDKAYTAAAKKAWTALVARLQPDGLLPDVCAGTGQSADVQYYLDRPRVTGDLHGQAPMLWLADALLRL